MDAFSNFQPLVPDEECLQENSAMSGDGGTTYADDGASFRLRQQQQQLNESHSSVLSRIGNFEQTGSDVLDREEVSDAEESGILIRFVEGRDTMYGAPNACSTGLSFLQPEIIDTLNSLLPKTRRELADEDTASGFPGLSMTGTSPLSQYTIESSSSAESLSQHSFFPRTSNVGDSSLSAVGAGHRNKNKREEAVGMCASDDASRRVRNLQELRMSEGNFNESRLSRFPRSSEASGESHLSQYPCSSSGSGGSRLSQYPMSDVSGLIQDFDTLIQGSTGGDIKASHLSVIDAFSGVTRSVTLPEFTVVDAYVGDTETGGGNQRDSSTELPQFSVVDAFVGDTETGGRKERDNATELPQFTIVDAFVDDSVLPGNLAQHESSSQRWARAQFDVVDAVIGSLGREAGGHPRDERLVHAECKTLKVAEEDGLRLETPPLYPLESLETCKKQGVASLTDLHMTAGLETYTYKEPEPGDLQPIALSSTARSATSSVTTLPESGDFQLFASASVTKSAKFPASPQLMSGDMTCTVATPATKSVVLPSSQQLMSGDLPQSSASVTSHLVSSSQSQVIVTSDAKFATPHALQQPLASNLSHLNSTRGSELVPSSLLSATVDRPSGLDTLHRGSETGRAPDGASHVLPPRIPVVQDAELQGSLAEIQKKWMQLQFDRDMSELEKTMTSPKKDKKVEFAKPLDIVLSEYENLQWKTLKAEEAQLTSDLICPQSTSIVGLPFDINNQTESSMRLSMDILQMSIGDTLVHTGRAPLGSSTPITKEDRLTIRRLQAMQTIQDSEERSDSGRASRASTAASADPEMDPAKLEAKSGSDVEYMPAEERRRLLEPNIDGSFERDRAADGEQEGRVSNRNDASNGRVKNITDKAAEAEACKRTMQSRSKGVGEELNLRSGPESRDAVVGENVEDQRNVELEWVERQSGRRSRTASSSGCSLGDSAPDFRAPMEPVRSTGICDRVSNNSGSFEDLRLTYKRKEPLGEERKDVKHSVQALAEAVEVEGGYDEHRDSERDSCSEGSDVDKVHQLYLSCLRDEDTGMSEEEDDKMEDKEGGDEAAGKHEEEQDEKSRSKNLTEVSESREDLTKIQPRGGSLYGVKQKSDSKPVSYGGSAVVISDNDSLASSLPRSSFSGSDIEDGLSEDVKRILAKYGRRFSNLKLDNTEKSETELNDRNLDQVDNRPPGQMEEELSAKSEDETSGNEEACLSKRNSKSVSFQSGDFQEKASAVPKEPSKTYSENAERSFLRSESSLHANTLRKLVDQSVESPSESSDDTLGKRVNDLLAKTDRMLEKKSEVAAEKSPSRRSSATSSQTGSVDYGVLQKDLDELEMSLDSMKKGDFVSHLPELAMSWTNKQPLTTPLSGSLASGAEVSRGGSRGLQLLLSSGLVPVNLALDMVHGSTDDLSDDGGTNAFSSGVGRLGVSEAAHDSARMRINEEGFDDKSDFTSETDTRMEENQRISDAFALEHAVTTQSGFSASQSCLNAQGKSKTLEATMDDWSQNHISSFPEMSLRVDDDGSSRSRGSFQENVTMQRGLLHGSRYSNVSQQHGLRDSMEANVTVGRGSNSFRESVTKNFSADVGQGSEIKNVGGATDVKENQSSGYSGSGSLPRSDISLGFRVAKADQISDCSQTTFAAGQPLTSTGWNGKSLRPVQGSVSPTERPVELIGQSEMKRNLLVNENIDKDSYFGSSLDSVGSNKSADRAGKGDARMPVNLVSGYGGSLNAQSNQAGSVPYEKVPNSISAGFQSNQSKQLIRDSDVTVPQQRTSRQDSEISGFQKRYDDFESDNLSHNESSFSGSAINNNENNMRATPVSDIHELDSFEDAEPISAVRVHRAKFKHDRAESTGQPIESSDCESQEGEWTEQFLDGVEPDAYYLSESMLESGDDQFSAGFGISPLRKHSPFKASKSVQLLLAAQLNRAKVSTYETDLHPSKHTITSTTLHERVSSSSHDLDNVSGDSSGTLVVNDSTVTAAADETLKPVAESFKERSGSKPEDYPSDHDSQLNSHDEQSSSSAMQHASLTTVTSLRDSTDCDNNLILEFPTRSDNRSASTSPMIVPYRPVTSRDVYYVDSGTDDGSVSAGGHSEATVESTHAGSDDARAPNFPAEVLGTRSDAPMDAMRGIKMIPTPISKATDLSTIEELSVVQTSSDRHMSDNCAASNCNQMMEKSRKKEFEQSLEKTKNWVNGISSSLPDMCTPSKAHRTSLGSLSDSNFPVGSRDGQATTFPDRPFNVASGKPRSLHGEQIRKAGDAVDSMALPSGVNEMPGKQLKKGVVERGSKGVTMSTAVPNISADERLILSRAAQENRLPPSVGISTEPGNKLHCEPCSMPTFASDRDKSVAELRSTYFEEHAAMERTVDPTLKPEDRLESLTSTAALDRFVSDRFAGRFESHYGLMPGVQSIVEQYADEKDMKKKREVEEELNRTHTVHESPFRSSRDLSEAAAGDSVQRRERMEQMDLLPSKSLDSALQMMSLTESNTNHASKSRSNTLPGQVAEPSMENSENLPQTSSRFSKDAFVSRLWEKFHESGTSGSSESESSSRRAEVSALQLVSLVNNPVKHIVKHLQREREENRQVTDGRETQLDQSGSQARIDEGTSLRSADSYQTYVMDTGRAWDLAREAAAGKDGERPSGSYNSHGTARKGAGDQSASPTGRSRGGGRGLVMNGAGEKSSSDDEHEQHRRKLVHGDYGKAEVLKKLLEKEEREKQKREEGRRASSNHGPPTTSKRAWIIQDEVLPVVPENRTIDSITSEFTSSSVDESGKIVTRTTKRHLPDDPKLLKLQQKIARQKEKYKQAYFREHRRKEKIAQLEMLYLMQQSEAGVEPTNVGSSLESFSQPPSVALDSTPQNMTSDNSALCFNCYETDGSACVCVRLKSKHPALQKSLPEEIAHGIKMKKSSPNKKRVGKSAPVIALELREVDYSEDDRARKDELVHSKRVHGSHPRTVSSPKRSGNVAHTKSSPKKIASASPDRKTPSFLVPKDSCRAITVTGRNDPNSDVIQRKLKSKSVDFGMNFPTPRHETRKSLRSKGVQTTPRLEDPELLRDARSCVSERRSYHGSRPHDVGVISIPVRGRVKVRAPGASHHASHGTFVTESRDHEWHLQTRSKVKPHKIRPRKSYPRGIAWFVPLKKTASCKSQQPLRFTDLYQMHCDSLNYTHMVRDNCDKENAVHLDQSNATIVKESPMDFVGSRTMHKESAAAVLRENANNLKKFTSGEVFPNATEGFVLAKGGPSLQELFRSNMQAFISRSREREKHNALRAEERRIQELHAKERLQLFGSNSRGSSILHTDPCCERLFKPRKRWFTKQQMKMMTNRRYRNLPEVMKMVEQRQKTERCQANRQRVQMFKQKILSHVLSEKNRRTAA